MRFSLTRILGFAVAAFALTFALLLVLAPPAVTAQEGTPTASESGACPAASGADAATPAASDCVAITAFDIYFAPNLVTIPADTDVTIMLPNKGVTDHNFSITDHKNPDVKNLNISVDLPTGETQSVTVNAPAGTYYFFCNVPGHEAAGMFGYLIVEEGATISAERATVTPPAGS
jgi:uncharacterized cupredoxin-like copper-binding protein